MYRRAITALALALAASGCANVETATRNAPLENTEAAAQEQIDVTRFAVQQVNVAVPRDLEVSEANRYYPDGDIVWREDPVGDRHTQVQAIVAAGLQEGVRNMTPGDIPVALDVEVTRFHALTEKARYSVGGVHSIQFKMQLRDPQTGSIYGTPQFVKADFKALGGRKALEAESRGVTQKYRITKHLAKVIQQQLTSVEGYKAANLGVIGALNQLGANKPE